MPNYIYIVLVFLMACSAKEEVRDTSLDDQIEANYNRNKELLGQLEPFFASERNGKKAVFFSTGSNLLELKEELGLTIEVVSRSERYSYEFERFISSAKIYLDSLVNQVEKIEPPIEFTQLIKAAQAQHTFAKENNDSWDGFNHLLLQFSQLEHKLLAHYLILVGAKSTIYQPGYMFFKDSVLLANEPTQFVIKMYPRDLLDRVHIRFTEPKIYSAMDTSNWFTGEVIKMDKIGLISLTLPEPGTFQLELDMVLTDTITGIEKKVPIKEELSIIDEYWEEIIFELDSTATGLNFTLQNNYTATKQQAEVLRTSLAQKYLMAKSDAQKQHIADSAQQLFTNYLLNQIVPHWYGTEWEFDGYTAIPNKGAIACGYFVSTTLLHIGVNVNRYKLAQQNPENEAKTVAIDASKVKEYTFEESRNDIFLELATYQDGLYFVGLDYHVGYLYIKNQQPYFIHSDYIDGFVRIEPAKGSYAFESYAYFISPISTNKEFIIKWLLQEEVEVVRGN